VTKYLTRSTTLALDGTNSMCVGVPIRYHHKELLEQTHQEFLRGEVCASLIHPSVYHLLIPWCTASIVYSQECGKYTCVAAASHLCQRMPCLTVLRLTWDYLAPVCVILELSCARHRAAACQHLVIRPTSHNLASYCLCYQSTDDPAKTPLLLFAQSRWC
jgi:hypothetical protein